MERSFGGGAEFPGYPLKNAGNPINGSGRARRFECRRPGHRPVGAGAESAAPPQDMGVAGWINPKGWYLGALVPGAATSLDPAFRIPPREVPEAAFWQTYRGPAERNSQLTECGTREAASK